MQKDIAANAKAVSDEATRADTEEKRLAGLIGTNAENIQKNADAIAALNAADGKVANASKADVASSLDETANAKAVSDEATRADTEEKRLAGLIGTNAENIQKNAEAISALSGADGKVAAASKADVASSLDEAAVAQVKGIVVDKAADANTLGGKAASEFATAVQGEKADTAVQPAALNDYYTKSEADAEFMNSGEVDAKIAALDLANTYDAKGAAATAEANAIAHANGLAGNYATAAQGAKADTALQEITTTANNGLKVTNKNQIDIDTSVVFVFNCGSSTEVM